jgi:DNA-binding NtrC family response regulator
MANSIQNGPCRIVLLVEDEADARTILARRLPALGWRCLVHESVESALAAPELTTVDAIAADVSFCDGRMSGVELVLELRSRGVCVPVVLMSGVADAKRLVAALQPGAAVLLEKPFATEMLRSALENAMRNPGSLPGAEPAAAGSH